ncbi:DUF5615 family PIN-like protein [Patescibacteria group bacterium]|nr:DUF5615 family PIN-like protein [Patescibacteria group bacterium]
MLKILADECIHIDLILAIKKRGFDVISIREAGLIGASDKEVFNFAVREKRILLTFDRGFGDIFRFAIARSAGVVVVLIDQMTKKEIIEIVLGFLAFIKASGVGGRLAIIGKNRARIIER